MNRRNVLLGLGGMAVGSGVLFGTGAFSSVEADRGITVAIAGDAAAYLGIEGHDDYTTTETVGGVEVVEIDMGAIGGDGGGEGVNQQAETIVDEILTFTNQSANDIDISLSSTLTEVSFDPAEITGVVPGASEPTSITVDTTEGPDGPLGDAGDELTITANDATEPDPEV